MSGSTFFTSGAAFSSADETWRTPKSFYDTLHTEFGFSLDVAALSNSTLVPDNWYGPDHPDVARQDAFIRNWSADAGGGCHLDEPSVWPDNWSVDAYGGGRKRCWVYSRVPGASPY